MLAVNVGGSLSQVVDGVDCKPTPILLLPVDGSVASAALDMERSWLASAPEVARQQAVTSSRAALGDDASYRFRRQRNNEAARRSREKRRRQDGVIRRQLEALVAENRELRCQLTLMRRLLDEVAVVGQSRKDDSGTMVSPHDRPVVSLPLTSGDLSRIDVDSATGDGRVSRRSSSRSSSDAAAESTTLDVDRVKLTDDASDFDCGGQHCSLIMPLNLSQRVGGSS